MKWSNVDLFGCVVLATIIAYSMRNSAWVAFIVAIVNLAYAISFIGLRRKILDEIKDDSMRFILMSLACTSTAAIIIASTAFIVAE